MGVFFGAKVKVVLYLNYSIWFIALNLIMFPLVRFGIFCPEYRERVDGYHCHCYGFEVG